MRELEGRIAVVTGAAKGIGRGTCKTLAERGAKVILTGRGKNVYDSFEELKKEGYDVSVYVLDVSDEDNAKKVIDQIVNEHGNIDILVNNAGVYCVGTPLEMTNREIDMMMNINTKGVVKMIRAVLPYMIKNNYGRIINISSICGIGGVSPNETYYAMTKSALLGLTKGIALSYASNNITVNTLCPGIIHTPLLEKAAIDTMPDNPQAALDLFATYVPVQRLGRPEDIGNAVAFLADERSGFINGVTIPVDGGQSQKG
ncbi:glucose 1-dehydrogenase [Alkalibaculum sp. M08DMB]|uniref:Glucose 1-dehydrogenase n=1 Tax=Alkalibaculum sporogenes TaxID=2655001 RepID=A0A6A7KB11_9FIRM|nr:SDR family oxidoreductase [Alkalibaculum sporogenes]MPW26535.1 glucose 1-dehydrogenase [Alkalibaculum sporogenes]